MAASFTLKGCVVNWSSWSFQVPEDMQDKEFAAILQDDPMQPLALVPLTEEEQVGSVGVFLFVSLFATEKAVLLDAFLAFLTFLSSALRRGTSPCLWTVWQCWGSWEKAWEGPPPLEWPADEGPREAGEVTRNVKLDNDVKRKQNGGF